MSRTKRSSNLQPFRKLNVSPKSQNQHLESSKDQGVHTSKIAKYAEDDYEVAAWDEKLKMRLKIEPDDTVSFYRNGQLLVNLTRLEFKNFNWNYYFPKFA